jgi:hypothetical protein
VTASESRAHPTPRAPKPSPGASATPALLEHARRGHVLWQPEPDEERSLRLRLEPGERGERAVAAGLVPRPPLLDGLLRARERGDACLLHGSEDPGEDVVLEQLDAADELRTADCEAQPPAGHPVALGHAEQLDADMARTVDGEEAARFTAVVDEIAVGKVVENPCLASLGPLHRVFEETLRHGRGRWVGGEVEVHRVSPLGEPGEGNVLRSRERDRGEVIGIAGIGQHDRPAALDGAERKLHQPGLRPRQHSDLACRVHVHAVDLAVALRDRVLQRRKAREG